MLLMLELHDGSRNKQQFTTLIINDDKINLHLHFMYYFAVYTMLFPLYTEYISLKITLQNNVHKPQKPTVSVCVCAMFLPSSIFLFSFISQSLSWRCSCNFCNIFLLSVEFHTNHAHALNRKQGRNTGSVPVIRCVHNRPGKGEGTQKDTLRYITLRLFSVRFIALIQRINVETDEAFCLVGLFVVKKQ